MRGCDRTLRDISAERGAQGKNSCKAGDPARVRGGEKFSGLNQAKISMNSYFGHMINKKSSSVCFKVKHNKNRGRFSERQVYNRNRKGRAHLLRVPSHVFGSLKEAPWHILIVKATPATHDTGYCSYLDRPRDDTSGQALLLT